MECCTSGYCFQNDEVCPYYKKDEFGDIEKCTSELIGDTLSLIKELTSENEKRTINMNAYGLTAKRLAEEKEWLIENYRKLKCVTMSYESFVDGLIPNEELIADTVRKMQERIREYFPYDADSGLYVVLDQIAEEIIGDGKQ